MESPLLDATDKAIAAAKGHLTDMDAGAVEAVRALARKIDAWDVIVQWALSDADDGPQGSRPKVPANDNVSLASYLKYCEALGLVPAGRKAVAGKPEGKKAGGSLASVSNIPRPGA